MANHGKNARVYVNGRDLTRCFREAEPTFGKDVSDASTFGTNDKEYVAGMRYGSIRFDGIYKAGNYDATSVLDEAFSSDADRGVLYAPNGVAVGADVIVFQALAESHNVGTPINDVAHVACAMQANGGLHAATLLVSPEVP